MFPWYFPTLAHQELKTKKVLYLLLLLQPDEVVLEPLMNKNDFDIGHFAAIHKYKKWILMMTGTRLTFPKR